MRIFVTGATGYIGQNVALALRWAGHDVWGLVRSPEKATKLERHEIHPVFGSMEAPSSFLATAEKCTVLIQAAEAANEAERLDRETVDALLSIATRGSQPKAFVYTSGTWVYGNTGGHAVDEATPTSPVKRKPWRPAHEQAVLEAANVRGIVIRPGCVYGRQGGLTEQWFKGPSEGRSPLIIGDGTNRWAMIHIDDLALGYVKAVESGRSSEIFNFTDRSRHTVLECAMAASRAAGYKDDIAHMSISDAEAKFGTLAECFMLDQHVDSRKAVRILNWQPRHGGFVDEVETYFAAWKAHRQ